jgi:glycosyltransferase involved in cell wall biosynthesis
MIAYTNYETDPRVIRAAEAAAEAGFEVDVIALRRLGQPPVEIVRGVRVWRLPQERYRGRSRMGYVLAYLMFFLRCLWTSTVLWARHRYRVIHVNNMPDVLVFSVIVPRIFGAKVILDIHDPMPETLGAKYAGANRNGLYWALLLMERLSVAFSSRTVTVNHPVRDRVLVKHGYSVDAIDVIANFADDRLFTLIPYPPIGERVRFVFHGTILERYGLRTLVAAVAQVRHRDKIHVRLIGEGDFSAALKQLISDSGVEDVIEFVNRVYPLHEIPQVLSDCHVGLVPLDVTPISDCALPLKLVEYTCLGLPSITVNSTAVSYYLRPEECLLYPPNDASSLASIIDRIAENPACLHEYRKRLPAAQERMSWSREKQKYIAMLRVLSGELADRRYECGEGTALMTKGETRARRRFSEALTLTTSTELARGDGQSAKTRKP